MTARRILKSGEQLDSLFWLTCSKIFVLLWVIVRLLSDQHIERHNGIESSAEHNEVNTSRVVHLTFDGLRI